MKRIKNTPHIHFNNIHSIPFDLKFSHFFFLSPLWPQVSWLPFVAQAISSSLFSMNLCTKRSCTLTIQLRWAADERIVHHGHQVCFNSIEKWFYFLSNDKTKCSIIHQPHNLQHNFNWCQSKRTHVSIAICFLCLLYFFSIIWVVFFFPSYINDCMLFYSNQKYLNSFLIVLNDVLIIIWIFHSDNEQHTQPQWNPMKKLSPCASPFI